MLIPAAGPQTNAPASAAAPHGARLTRVAQAQYEVRLQEEGEAEAEGVIGGGLQTSAANRRRMSGGQRRLISMPISNLLTLLVDHKVVGGIADAHLIRHSLDSRARPRRASIASSTSDIED